MSKDIEEQRRRNREMFPEFAAIFDEVKRVFGQDCKVVKLEINPEFQATRGSAERDEIKS